MIKEILSRLERIDHKEYSCGFEFADSSTFNEMARCFEERKILVKEIERLNNIINEFEKILINDQNFFKYVYKNSHLSENDFRDRYPYTIGCYDYCVELLNRLKRIIRK